MGCRIWVLAYTPEYDIVIVTSTIISTMLFKCLRLAQMLSSSRVSAKRVLLQGSSR